MEEPDKRNLVWLASYPKSGNTWFRAFLSNILEKSEKPADINRLSQTPIASSRQIFDEATGISSSDLNQMEIRNLRPSVYRYLAKNTKDPMFHKIHDAWIHCENGEPLIPQEVTLGVIYFIRNPLDVAISFAHHAAQSIDQTIQNMNQRTFAFCSKADRLHNQLEQILLDWSGHVLSWTRDSGLPIHVMRFEDMKSNPNETFKKALDFIGIQAAENEIEKAIRFSSFDELKKQEDASGFREKSPKASSFFRKGQAGGWKESLSLEQVNRIITVHATVMKQFGYLDEENHPL